MMAPTAAETSPADCSCCCLGAPTKGSGTDRYANEPIGYREHVGVPHCCKRMLMFAVGPSAVASAADDDRLARRSFVLSQLTRAQEALGSTAATPQADLVPELEDDEEEEEGEEGDDHEEQEEEDEMIDPEEDDEEEDDEGDDDDTLTLAQGMCVTGPSVV